MPGIYIHIPFCKQACHYCNFHFSTSLRKKEELLAAIIKEIELATNDNAILKNVDTLYFGGGTPSIIDASEIDKILKIIFSRFKLSENAEITLEANPDDISDEKLSQWKNSGINRLSIGLQSFFQEDLKWMHRAHNAQQAIQSLQKAKKYFSNITIDLIYGIPGLDNTRWHQNVQTAIDLDIPHLSCYALTVEPKTPLYKMVREQKKKATNETHQSEQFLLLMNWLEEKGYEQYEISNFAKPGYRSRHNSSYWNGEPYIGIGPSAHSYDGDVRWWNIANNQKYIAALQNGTLPFEKELLTDIQKFNEYIMLSLRTTEGIDLYKIKNEEQKIILKNSEKFLNENLMHLDGHFLRLTKQGKLFADGIAAELFF
jgi:oxygen-independent coproporphyrinogen III oxidase